MIVMLTAGFIFSATHIFGGRAYPLGNPEVLTGGDLINGRAASRWGDVYNKDIPFRQAAIDLFGVIKFTLFREGSKGVLVGEDRWLFTTEEFEAEGPGGQNMRRSLAFIDAVKARMEADDVTLLIAVVPAKARVYPEKLGRYRFPASADARLDRLISSLEERGIATISLKNALIDGKNGGMTFLATDTHWTPHGASVSADAVAAAVPADISLTSAEIAPAAQETQMREGDLRSYVPLAGMDQRFGFRDEPVEPFLANAVSNDLFGDAPIDVVLVGTSYSANELFSFSSHLRRALGADVLNVAQEGKGPFEPMRDYLVSDTYADGKPKLVIWELPERFVDKAYGDDVFDFTKASEDQAGAEG